ncbi:translation elongation factor Ts [Deinococcus roseus]|uniref:Elongation factor Ts n=1 Tax=Deinococcus roseus TaxID=392414 RepID=A0ABQ2CWG9_9DEIO|nr:translation elongation factor Ts [Deinococcus roseus]GGJ23056.1 elongation factor Ts [Deinococcus roseus]
MMESIKRVREITSAGIVDVKKALTDAEGNEEKAVALLRERGIAKAGRKADREAKEGLIAFQVSEDGKRAALVEVNSETDFVARNADFQALVKQLAEVALNARTSDLEVFKNADLGNGETADTAVKGAAGKIGENIVLSRVAYLESDGVVGAYVHSNGKIGSLVALSGADAAVAKDIALHVAAERPRYLDRSEVDNSAIEAEREILTNKAINEGKPAQIVEKIVAGQLGKFYEETVLREQKFVKDNSLTVAKYAGDNTINSFVRFEIGSK